MRRRARAPSRQPRISRSVLAARLRKLEELGIVTGDPSAARAVPGYCLTHAGLELRPILQTFRQWSERFVPEDPAMVERDLDIVLKWLAGRIDPEHLPAQQVVLDLNIGGTRVKASLARVGARRGAVDLHRRSRPGRGPLCLVETDLRGLDAVSRGQRSWRVAIADSSIRLFGEPTLVRALPRWFGEREPARSSPRERALAG
jgi:hypothetical protein